MPKRLKKVNSTDKNEEKDPSENERFSLSDEKKLKIIGFFLIVLSLLFLISILTYSSYDIEGTGAAKTSGLSNLLGVAGAWIAYFCVEKTLGYFSIIFPILMSIWGYGFFSDMSLKRKLNYSIFFLMSGVVLSSFVGLAYSSLLSNQFLKSFSGVVGSRLAAQLKILLGMAGSILVLLTALIVLFVFAFDFKVEILVEKGKTSGESVLMRIWHLITKPFKKSDSFDETELPIQNSKPEAKPAKASSRKPEIKAQEEPKEESLKAETQIIIKRNEAQKKQKTGKKKDLDSAETFEVEEKGEGEKPVISFAEEDLIGDEFFDDSSLPDPWDENIDYQIPMIDSILEKTVEEDVEINDLELKAYARQLKEKLSLFDIAIENIEVFPGPVVTMYEITPAPGVKISKIVSLENDIAMALAARGIRIIAPIPGKSAIGVEIPNAKPQVVSAYSVLSYAESLKDKFGKFKIGNANAELPLSLGKTITGEVYIGDLAKIPHLLVAGSTGSGKSVGINMIIASLLFAKKPSELKFAIIDPKKIELSFYQKLRYHYLAVCPDLKQDIVTDPGSAKILLKSLEIEMDQRYDKLANAGVKGIVEYNAKVSDPNFKFKSSKDIKHHFLPYIVVVIDELADLMMTSGREVEEPIARIAQLARAVGIHLIVATQRPSVDVITGMIKANFNARIAYQVATKVDSRTILDMNGAEQLLGRGDMLYLPPGTPKPTRLQNAFISVEEVEKLTDTIGKQSGYSKPYFLPSIREKKQTEGKNYGDTLDPLFEDAARVIVQNQQGSVSLLQRRLKLGYARAARIVDQLEENDIVGPNDGSKGREVKIKNEEELETKMRGIR